MDNNNRKTLSAVIFEYIQTTRPVSSKQISRRCGYSSSSIRNRMLQLEKNGYLKSIYTSSGKVPTDKGWRFYIEELLETQQLIFKKKDELKKEYVEQSKRQNISLVGLAKMFFYISQHSNYNLSPKSEKVVFREIILTAIDKRTIFGVVFASYGAVKQFMLKTEKTVQQDFLNKVSDLINKLLNGIVLSDIKNKIETLKIDYQEELSFISQNIDNLFDLKNNLESEDVHIASKISETYKGINEFLITESESKRNKDDKQRR